jgi:TIR domain-containing protein
VARIFISYRRDEAAAYAGWLTQILDQQLGTGQVFRDIDSIEPGLDFMEVIHRELDSCEVMLVLIGRTWLTMKGSTGRPRLQEPNDYVRLEIAAALARQDVRVIPLILQGASMPRADELPDDLVGLTHRNAIELRDTSWYTDVGKVLTALERTVGSRGERQFRVDGGDVVGEDIGQVLGDVSIASSSETKATLFASVP